MEKRLFGGLAGEAARVEYILTLYSSGEIFPMPQNQHTCQEQSTKMEVAGRVCRAEMSELDTPHGIVPEALFILDMSTRMRRT